MEKFLSIISILISVATFFVMLFGIRLGKKAMFKNQTVFGKEADDWYNSILEKLNTADVFVEEEYQGGNKATPQFEIERFQFDKDTMPAEWKKYKKLFHRYYKKDNIIMVKGWRM